MSMCQQLKRMAPVALSSVHCLVEGGAEGVLERGALETFVVVDRIFANELHLRFCAGSF